MQMIHSKTGHFSGLQHYNRTAFKNTPQQFAREDQTALTTDPQNSIQTAQYAYQDGGMKPDFAKRQHTSKKTRRLASHGFWQIKQPTMETASR